MCIRDRYKLYKLIWSRFLASQMRPALFDTTSVDTVSYTHLAVLGCGPDVVYPRENSRLAREIIDSGAIISEFPPGTPPEPWRFPVRNRLISGLSQGTVVVEAAEKSGALITADFALEQGRDVMAVPGNVVNPLSRGPHRLIKQEMCIRDRYRRGIFLSKRVSRVCPGLDQKTAGGTLRKGSKLYYL